MKAGRRRGASSVAAVVVVVGGGGGLAARGLLVVDVLFVVDAVDALRAENLVDALCGVDVVDALRAEALFVGDKAGACSWRTERAWGLRRPRGRLLAAVAVVVVVEAEAVEPTDGGRGGRKVVELVRAVAWDFARVCVLVGGGCGLGVVVVVVEGPGLEARLDASLVGAEDMDLGLVSLLDMERGRAGLVGAGFAVVSFCVVAGLRVVVVAVLLDRSRPKMAECGLLLVPEAAVVEVEGIAVRAVVAVAVLEAEVPNLGSLLGELSRVSAVGALLVVSRSRAGAVGRPPPPPPPPGFSPGCRSERDQPRAGAEDDDDMV